MIQQALAFLMERGKAEAPPVEAKHGSIMVAPPNYTLMDLGKYAELYASVPRRKVGHVQLRAADSFNDYWKAFKTEASRIFADPESVTLTAIMDYHYGASEAPAGWREHRASFTMTITKDWATWLAGDGKKMNQIDFATFIEDNTPDIYKPKDSQLPDAATMLETARELQAKGEVEFASHTRMQDGRQKFIYTDSTTATIGKGEMSVPEEFLIRLIPYVGSGSVEVKARLRFRIAGGKLTFWYDLFRPHKIKEEAFASALARIEEACQTTILIGTP